MTQPRFYYEGATPGANTNDTVLFDSTTLKGWRHAGIKRMMLSLDHSHDGTLKEYKSVDGGVTWIQIEADEAITAVAAEDTFREYQVQPYDDWRLVWENGGSAQTSWTVSLAGDTESF